MSRDHVLELLRQWIEDDARREREREADRAAIRALKESVDALMVHTEDGEMLDCCWSVTSVAALAIQTHSVAIQRATQAPA